MGYVSWRLRILTRNMMVRILLLLATFSLARGAILSSGMTEISKRMTLVAPPVRPTPIRVSKTIHESIMARKIVHISNWTSVSYISHAPEMTGLPSVALFSVSDGMGENGTGIPYFYVSRLQDAVTDLIDNDNHCALMMSLAQTEECKNKSLDAEDPRCAHIILSGTFHSIDVKSREHNVAKEAVFSRHPGLVDLPENHHFFFAKLNISKIVLQDRFGGPIRIPVDDYFNVYEYLRTGERGNNTETLKMLAEAKLMQSSGDSPGSGVSFFLLLMFLIVRTTL